MTLSEIIHLTASFALSGLTFFLRSWFIHLVAGISWITLALSDAGQWVTIVGVCMGVYHAVRIAADIWDMES